MAIVLGAFTGTPSPFSLPRNHDCHESSTSASYILGTSYFASTPASLPHVGRGVGSGSGISNSGGGFVANSSGDNHRRVTALGLNKDGRVPMSDRKGPFDQFKPKSLILSVSEDFVFWGGFPILSRLFHF